MTGALATCWLVVAAATYDVSVRSEARARSPQANETSTVATDLDLQPSLSLSAGSTRLIGDLGYSARLLLREPMTEGRTGELLHHGRARGTWVVEPTFRLFLQELASYGVMDFSAVQAGAAEGGTQVPLDLLLSLEPVPYFSTETTAGFVWRLEPTVQLTTSVGYAISGGRGEGAQRLPVQRGPRLAVAAEVGVTPVDLLTTDLNATHAAFSNGRTATLFTGSEIWTHRLSSATQAILGAGLGLARLQGPDSEPSLEAMPTLTGTLAHRIPMSRQGLDGRLSLQVSPYIDPVTGGIYQRIEASAQGQWEFDGRWTIYARGGHGRAIGSAQSASVTLFDGGTGYLLMESVRVEAGTRLAWTEAGGGQQLQWVTMLSLVLGTRGEI